MNVNEGTTPAMNYRQYREHHLGDVKRMSPIVVSNVPVVLLHTQQPATQYFVVYVKPLDKVHVQKHS